MSRRAAPGAREIVGIATLSLPALLLLAAFALPTRAQDAEPAVVTAQPVPANPAAAQREQQFLYLLRTYPERSPAVTLGQVAQLIDQGPFAERDRAEFWIGSARLALGDRQGARHWFGRLARDTPDSIWVQRSYLGLAEAASMEHQFEDSLAWYARAAGAKDPAVRELARIARPQILVLQRRQKLAWLAAAIVALGSLTLLALTWRAARRSAPGKAPRDSDAPGSQAQVPPPTPLATLRRALAPPAEARILLPLLGVVALAALRQDAAARAAALELCLLGAVLVWLSGAYLRARPLRLPLRALYAAGMLSLLFCGAYLAIWRNDLVGMVQETWRAGPD